jgi:hypothetical protein
VGRPEAGNKRRRTRFLRYTPPNPVPVVLHITRVGNKKPTQKTPKKPPKNPLKMDPRIRTSENGSGYGTKFGSDSFSFCDIKDANFFFLVFYFDLLSTCLGHIFFSLKNLIFG